MRFKTPIGDRHWSELLIFTVGCVAILWGALHVGRAQDRIAVEHGAMLLVRDRWYVLWTDTQILGELRQWGTGSFSLVDNRGLWSYWHDELPVGRAVGGDEDRQ